MIEIVPAILTDDPAELERLIEVLKTAGATRVHLDILDDTLVPGRTVTGYDQLDGRDVGVTLDVHLMVARPDEHISQWKHSRNIGRFIAHVESNVDLEQVSAQCKKTDDEFWAALNPDTPLDKIRGFAGHIDGAMFMTVQPGAQGRPFREDVLEKIRLLKVERPELLVMVDGGITPDTAPGCTRSGASVLVCGSYIVQSPDPAMALESLAASVRRN